MVKRVIECGASPLAQDKLKIHPLMLAVDKGHLEIVEWLVQAILLTGGDLHTADSNGLTALHWAGTYRFTEHDSGI
jgi:ankyrin repeat protein